MAEEEDGVPAPGGSPINTAGAGTQTIPKRVDRTAANQLSVDVEDVQHVCDSVCVFVRVPGGFCLHRLAEFSRENRRLSC